MVTVDYPTEAFPIPYQLIFIIAMIVVVFVISVAVKTGSGVDVLSKIKSLGGGASGKIIRVFQRAKVSAQARRP